jgi:radical SAM superfamily enzyme YgiQ (UPF0313 family)
MAKIKVCLVFPRLKYISGDPPMGVGYLAAYLKKTLNLDISVIDATFMRSFVIILNKLKEYKPDILGIYVDAVMTKDAISIADWARNNKLYTILGGPQATVLPEAFIAYADVIVRGEGELILTEVIRSYGTKDLSHIPGIWWKSGGEIIKNVPNQNFIHLDEMPFPERKLLPMDKYLDYWNYLDAMDPSKRGTTMIVSRGCPFSCSYCQPTIREMFGNKIRFRSPLNVVEEIKTLKEQYNIEGIFFHDDTFTIDYSWLQEFCRILENDKLSIFWGCNSRVDTVNEDMLKMMYRVGLRKIHFGIESGSQRILDNIYNKKIKIEQVKNVISLTRKIGVYTMGFFMLGAPSETEKDINKTISFAKNLRLEEASFFLTTPLVGTYLYNMILNNNKYQIDPHYEDFNYYSQYSIIKGGISHNRIKFLQLKAFLFFYLHPFRLKYVMKHMFSIRGRKSLSNKITRLCQKSVIGKIFESL